MSEANLTCSYHRPDKYNVSESAIGCQFHHLGFESVSCGDTYYCPFHLPGDYHRSNNDQEHQEWWKENFYKLIGITQRHDEPEFRLDLSGIKIPSNISLSGLKLSKVSFEYAEFVGNVEFSKSEFLDSLFSSIQFLVALQISVILLSMIVVTLNIRFFTALLCS